GKMDLAQAEAVADLIESSTEQAARSAMRSLQGEFSNKVNAFLQELTYLRMFVEASIDFADEEIDFLGEAQVDKQLQQLLTTLAGIQGSARQGRLLREGISVVLVGQPNAGKSSLHNRLAGHDAAIVTEVAGTTRDVLREQIHIGGLPLRISDTAGLHDATDDIVELEGIRRTQNELLQADHILLLIDDRLGMTEQDEKILSALPAEKSITLIRNKIDQSGHVAEITNENDMSVIYLSAKNGEGMELLVQHLCEVVGFHPEEEGVFMARRRHLDAL
ncbi:MAG TPA: tRNA uridine-5-carboxymethylaminomethyl(34) synthesis GTPase MnmE, partial [Methylophaga sp.]|nr:tRNA uridine-5-carboxymethylaminomethyl(34) synthesis GTPase MnmE [Methylophaga sp.]